MEESWWQVWWIWLCWVIGWVKCWLRQSMTRSKREPLKWNFCSFLQKFGMFHSGRHLETVSCSSFFQYKKHGQKLSLIFNHLSLSEIRLWKLAQASWNQPVSLFKDFIIKTSARSLWTRRSETEEAEDVDEDGCIAKSDIVLAEPLEMGYTLCVVFVHKFAVYWIHRPREWNVYNLTTTFHPIPPLCESTNFPKIQVYREGKWWNFMKSSIHEHGIL